ncbi:C-X-C chemokine receptor type 6 [Perognathus longimembris pacificus]|uniref:C-X-C chemokine receptor type 6 n=1 Tax=Perognathus longimembris pacificus TaxID=214514 RepID=UPI002018C4DD|nr:C-X-C chemokine receptor type 6 [Perognathus longimembris pacificus]
MEPTPEEEEEYQDPGLFGTPGDSRQAHERFLAFQRAFLPAVYLAVFALGLLGNALVLLVHARYQARRSLTDLLLLNLPLADLLFACTLPFWAYAGSREWVFGQAVCKALQGVYSVNLYASMLTLTGITAGRFVMVAQATRAHAHRERWAAWGRAACALTWAGALLLSLPQLLHSRVEQLDRLACHYHHEDAAPAALALQAALGFFLPLLAMLVCYPLVVRTLLRARGPRRRKPLKIILVAAAVFLLTQTPYVLARLVQATSWEHAASPRFGYALVVTEALAYLRACLNPVLYAFVGLKFRKNFCKLVRDLGCLPARGASSACKSSEDNSKTCSASPNAEATSMLQL